MNVLCVLRSGGIYDAEWVRKLRDGVARNMGEHRFICLSDVEVPCERIPLKHDWPGWWSKIEMFRHGVITQDTLYLDLDTVITGPLRNVVEHCKFPGFAMLENFHTAEMVGSGVMWFGRNNVPHDVYHKFVIDPQRIMDHYATAKVGPYMGDQAFIWDTLDRQVNTLNLPWISSYKKHCRNGLPKGTSIVCFHGRPRPTEINPEWMKEHWS